ncbi:hypothetical protein KGQ19_32225 [Catenulispora sp. NL8]|uniref:PE-PGRS family protein n=1 Tax=Catenulispora pinistramenti TaxID=2705254 RepID=A0ABS5KZX5_9ACTN|nr:hypothetical protein [Catenulispora pinistramenti]MBS2551545.1 hypothetical protein [Catenulispora pinistramenti]
MADAGLVAAEDPWGALAAASGKARVDWLLGLASNTSAPDELVLELFDNPAEDWHRTSYIHNRERRDVVTEAAINHPERKVRMLLVETGHMTAEQWDRLIDTFPDRAARGLAEENRDGFLGLARPEAISASPAQIAQWADAEEHIPPEAHSSALPWVAALHDDPDAMRQLAAHPNPLIRRGVARAPHLPPDVVNRLAHDEDRVVHLFLSESCDDTPAEVLLGVWGWWSGSFSFPGRPRNHPNFPTTGLLKYADDPDPHWRLLALADEASTPELVDRFAADPEFVVRLEAARDPRISPAALVPLLLEERLATNAAGNASIPVPVMRSMIELARDAAGSCD